MGGNKLNIVKQTRVTYVSTSLGRKGTDGDLPHRGVLPIPRPAVDDFQELPLRKTLEAMDEWWQDVRCLPCLVLKFVEEVKLNFKKRS